MSDASHNQIALTGNEARANIINPLDPALYPKTVEELADQRLRLMTSNNEQDVALGRRVRELDTILEVSTSLLLIVLDRTATNDQMLNFYKNGVEKVVQDRLNELAANPDEVVRACKSVEQGFEALNIIGNGLRSSGVIPTHPA